MCSFGLVVYNFYFFNFLNLLIYYFKKKQNALVALEGFFFSLGVVQKGFSK